LLARTIDLEIDGNVHEPRAVVTAQALSHSSNAWRIDANQ